MTPEQQSCLAYTVSHFQEIARKNRFAENGSFEHETDRCVICRPELLPWSPFAVYLEVVTQSIKVRRPSLDAELVEEINRDISLAGLSGLVTLESLLAGEKDAVEHWIAWTRDALATGLGLLSVHSPASLEFDLEEEDGAGSADLIKEKVKELMDYQLRRR